MTTLPELLQTAKCASPGCRQPWHDLYLRAVCHPRARIRAILRGGATREGHLRIECATCGAVVVEIAPEAHP